jgi:hypothetical protein
MSKLFFVSLSLILLSLNSYGAQKLPEPQFYRDYIEKIRLSGKFKLAIPVQNTEDVNYSIQIGDPVFDTPIVADVHSDLTAHPTYILREFWDKIFLKDGSFVEVAGTKYPLTCVYVRGQDNRFSGPKGPLYPDIILRVYLVANDYTCQGPIHPGWPQTGGKKEAWDTYLYYEVTDPTIMLPTNANLRYLWNEIPMVLTDKDAKQ